MTSGMRGEMMLAACLTLLVFSACRNDELTQQTNAFRLGILAPYQGSAYPHLIHLHRGADLAFSGDPHFHVIYENSDTNGRYGKHVVEKVIEEDRVQGLMGGTDPYTAIKASELATANQLIYISCYVNPIAWPDSTAFTYFTRPSDHLQIEKMAALLKHLDASKVVILADKDPDRILLAQAMMDELPSDVVAESGWMQWQDTLDWTSLQDHEVLIFFAEIGLTQILDMTQQSPSDGSLIFCEGTLAPHQMRAALPTNFYFLQLPLPKRGRRYRRFEKEFEKFYEKLNSDLSNWFDPAPNLYETYAYEAASILQKAIKAKGHDLPAIHDYLTTKTFKTVVGTLRFDQDGQPNRDFEVLHVSDGIVKVVELP